jgi:hypothetical protein
VTEGAKVESVRWRATRQIPAFYRDGLSRLRSGELGLRGWIWFGVLTVGLVGDETTTGYMVRHGFREGNPVAAAGFGSIGFWAFAAGTSLLVLALAAPIAVARTTEREMHILQWAVYLGILGKCLAVVNNVALFEHLWRGIHLSF